MSSHLRRRLLLLRHNVPHVVALRSILSSASASASLLQTCRSVPVARTCTTMHRYYSSSSSSSPCSSKPPVRPRLFSGIQPSGQVHLGNYLGAIQQWVNIQRTSSLPASDILLSIVDLHSLTTTTDGEQVRQAVREVTATLLGCGLDATRCIMFQQSSVKQHAELAWILMCITPFTWLQGMAQFKVRTTQQRIKHHWNCGQYSTTTHGGIGRLVG
jgi:hypothetical protein